MKLEKLLEKIEYTLVKGSLDVMVKDIAYDSRKVLDSSSRHLSSGLILHTTVS